MEPKSAYLMWCRACLVVAEAENKPELAVRCWPWPWISFRAGILAGYRDVRRHLCPTRTHDFNVTYFDECVRWLEDSRRRQHPRARR
jgi:hypothetical protein